MKAMVALNKENFPNKNFRNTLVENLDYECADLVAKEKN